MESQDRRKNNPSGNGVHVCHKCGWLFPNPHPSAKQRRAHKRICGTIEVKSGNSGDHKTHLDASDNDSKTLISETMEKVEEMTVSSRSISGFGSGSNRSNRSEEDVFSDAVTDFPVGVSDSDDVREPAKNKDFSEENNVADAGSGEIDVPSQYHLSSSNLDSSSNSGLAVREEQRSISEKLLQCSEISVDLSHEEKGSVKGVQDKKSEDRAITLTENADITFDEKRDCSPKDEQFKSIEHSSQEVELVGHSEDNLSKEKISNISMAGPSERLDKISKDIISEALHQEDNFAEEVSVEKETGKTDSHAKMFTEEQNPLVFAEEISLEKETFFNASMAEPSENSVKISKDIITEALHQEGNFAEEVSVEKETEKTDSHATDTEEHNPLVNADANVQSVLDDSENYSHSVSSMKPVDDDYVHDNKDAEIYYALEADSFKEAREEFPLTNETSSISDICNTTEKNLLREEGNGDDYDVRITVVGKLSESTPSVPEFEDPIDDNCDAQIKKLQDSEEAVKDLGSPSELMVVEESVNVVDKVNVASDSADVSLTENDKDNVAQLEKIEVSGVKELENVGEDCFGKVDLGLISDNDDISESTQNAANGLNEGVHGESVSSVEDLLTKERNGTASALTDIQADSISQTDSLEANWGSVSVLSTLSDAPAATETGSQPSQESFKPEKPVLQPKSNNEKSVIFQPQSSISSVEQKAADKTDQNKASRKPEEHGGPIESSGKKRNEEIIAKVTNWSADKQHMPLKSYLGESSPGAKENPPQMSQEIINAVMAAKEQVNNEARVELSKEWNSPARYQSNIKREKSKVKRPYWAPFICCSSVQTS